MRLLLQPEVLKSAALAAVLSALACIPRLLLWEKRPLPIWYLAIALLLSAFVLWAFVFGWHEPYLGRNPFALSPKPGLWLLASVFGIAGAALFFLFVDPKLRMLMPEDFPTDLRSWLASTAFGLCFSQLFLVFAPVAFFARLFGRRHVAWVGTVLLNGFVVLLTATDAAFSAALTVQMALIRMAGVAVTVYFYLQGGVGMVWWMGLLSHARHLPGLMKF